MFSACTLYMFTSCSIGLVTSPENIRNPENPYKDVYVWGRLSLTWVFYKKS